MMKVSVVLCLAFLLIIIHIRTDVYEVDVIAAALTFTTGGVFPQ